MQALVTGVAGFIGSTLADRLLEAGWGVVGIDAFTPYYDVEAKEANLGAASQHAAFELVRGDLSEIALDDVLDGVDVVFHQAGQPGVRLSWEQGFGDYVACNVTATQRLLEAVRRRPVQRFVYASSSSIYGEAAAWPTSEALLPRPFSPYGVTKLAGEHLCTAYSSNFGVPTVSLRYFTVYGPRQRPDMATHRLIESARRGHPFPLYGDGTQVRDFTFVDDVVRANELAASADIEPGTVVNVAGGGSTTLVELVRLVGEAVGQAVPVDWKPAQPGDVSRTGGDTSLAFQYLGWEPSVTIEDGVHRQVGWHLQHLPLDGPAS